MCRRSFSRQVKRQAGTQEPASKATNHCLLCRTACWCHQGHVPATEWLRHRRPGRQTKSLGISGLYTLLGGAPDRHQQNAATQGFIARANAGDCGGRWGPSAIFWRQAEGAGSPGSWRLAWKPAALRTRLSSMVAYWRGMAPPQALHSSRPAEIRHTVGRMLQRLIHTDIPVQRIVGSALPIRLAGADPPAAVMGQTSTHSASS